MQGLEQNWESENLLCLAPDGANSMTKFLESPKYRYETWCQWRTATQKINNASTHMPLIITGPEWLLNAIQSVWVCRQWTKNTIHSHLWAQIVFKGPELAWATY